MPSRTIGSLCESGVIDAALKTLEMRGIEEEVTSFLTFLGAQRPRPGSVFILVMGLTGSGKTSFIADSIERQDAKVGHELESCTNSMAVFQARLEERDVYLIDTPGFDDTKWENMEILTAIAHYFSVSYANNVFINGIIYVHRISDNKLGGAARTNLEMLKGLCGRDAFPNVSVITTMWSPDGQERSKQEYREQQLKDIYLADMVKEGTQIVRHDWFGTMFDRRASAKAIFQRFFYMWKDDQATLQIQHEMINRQVSLGSTTAGRVLQLQMLEESKLLEKQLENISESRASDVQVSNESRRGDEILGDKGSEVRLMLQEHHKALEYMRLSILEIHRRQQERFMAQLRKIEDGWKDALSAKKEDYRLLEQEYQRHQSLRREETIGEREAALEKPIRAENERHELLSQLQEESQIQQLALTHALERNDDLTKKLEDAKIALDKKKLETNSKLEIAERAKQVWNSPLSQALVTGGLGIVGSAITTGKDFLQSTMKLLTVVEVYCAPSNDCGVVDD
ncbi:hypothetical protein M434DRAFT_39028 [Hypoxylon sp. CO27-5]|nr:hypothetical protein M434DRAFT_39028 [Hypoxylon sp. CO27-5]